MVRKRMDQALTMVSKRRLRAADAQLKFRASQGSRMPPSGFALEHGLQRALFLRWASRRRKRAGRESLDMLRMLSNAYLWVSHAVATAIRRYGLRITVVLVIGRLLSFLLRHAVA